jgi:hypothetical protein
MILSKKIIIASLLFLYLAVSLVSLSDCGKDNSDGTYDFLQKEKNKIASVLISDFDATMFDCGKIEEALNSVTVLDSTIVGIIEREGDYFIKAKITTGCEGKFFAVLKCDKNVVNKFNKSRSNKAFLVAQIETINNSQMVAEVDSLSGKNSLIEIGNVLLLKGECLAYNEIPTFVNAN